MNVFKKIYKELLERTHFDVKLRDHGISFNVDLDPSKESDEIQSNFVAVAVRGLYNSVGGILICALEEEGLAGLEYMPKLANTANKFLFLNGRLLPKNVPSRITLSEYVLKHLEEQWDADFGSDWICDSVDLEGCTVHYVYVPQAVVNRWENMDCDSLANRLVECSDSIFINKGCAVLIEELTEEPFGSSAFEENTRKVIEVWKTALKGQGRFYDDETITFNVSKGEDDAILVDELAEYLYSNILEMVHESISKGMSASIDSAGSIPWKNEKGQQDRWVKKLAKCVKTEKDWGVIGKFCTLVEDE